MFAIGVRLIRDMVSAAPVRLAAIALLTVLRSLSEGISLALLAPLLALASAPPSAATSTSYGSFVRTLASVAGPHHAAALALVFFLALLLFRALLGFVLTRMKARFLGDFVDTLRQRIYTAHSRASWLFLARSQHAHDVYALTSQTGMAGYAAMNVIDIAATLVTALVAVGVAFLISPGITTVVLVMIATLALPLLVFQKRVFQQGRTVMHAMQHVHSAMQARVSGLKLGKALACEPQLERQFSAISRSYRDAAIHASDLNASAQLVYEAGAAILLVILVVMTHHLLAMPAAELATLLIIFARLVPLANGIFGQTRGLAGTLPDYDTLLRTENAANAERDVWHDATRRMSMGKGLELRNVGVHYPVDADTWALRDVSVRLEVGTVTGIVGRSGAGKSTLADVMAGLIAPTIGELRIDGERLQPERQADWRSSIAYVTQDAPLFHDTIRNNLTLCAPDASDAQIMACLKTAHADALVARLPAGLDTMAGERGARLSGGERQRLRLASVLLRKPRLLILDEATNALNPADEAAITSELIRLDDMTIVVIAHRASSLMWTDRLIVVEEGSIIDDGPTIEVAKRHERLLSNTPPTGTDDPNGRDEPSATLGFEL